MTQRLIVVRHGNTFAAGEPLRRIGARTDLALTDVGQAQATAIGRHYAAQGVVFDRVLTGPLIRTRATADAIVALQPDRIELTTAQFLVEIDHGVDENALEVDVEARIGHSALDAWDAHGTCPPGWVDDRSRRIAAWRALAAARVEGTTLLVTSNGAARFALAAFALSPPSHKLRTGAWGTIAIDGAAIALIDWNVRP